MSGTSCTQGGAMSESEKTMEIIERLSAGNPGVDVDKLIEATKLIEKLREEGMPEPEYNIEPAYKPFPRRA